MTEAPRRSGAPVARSALILLLAGALVPVGTGVAQPPPAPPVADRLLHGMATDLEAAAFAPDLGCPVGAAASLCDALDGETEGSVVTDAEATEPALHARLTVPTPRWHAAHARLGSRVLRVHGYGDVVAVDASGSQVWARHPTSLAQDWGGVDLMMTPVVPLGASATNPMTVASERPFAVAELTGDGTPEVVVGHIILERTFDAQGIRRLRRSSRVTVLDGADGDTLWSRELPGWITQVTVTGDLIVAGNETGDERGGSYREGEDGTTSGVHAFRWNGGDPEPAWSWASGREWARLLDMLALPDGGIAVGWSGRPLGGSGEVARLLVLEAAGTVRWEAVTDGYPRHLRFDAGRGWLVHQEQLDPAGTDDAVGLLSDTGYRYRLVGRSPADGSVAVRVERVRSILTALTVADVTGDGRAEWLAGSVDTTDHPVNNGYLVDTIIAGRITAVDPEGAGAGWDVVRPPGDVIWSLHVVPTSGGPVLVAPMLRFADALLIGVRAGDGAMLWEQDGDAPFPLYAVRAPSGAPHLLGMTPSKIAATWNAVGGTVEAAEPVLADMFAAVASDVDGDGVKEVIVGGESEAVFALGQHGQIVWRSRVAGPVRELHVADVDGDGGEEVVVAATDGVSVLRAGDGRERWRVSWFGEFVWTVTVADVDGDGAEDVVVPTTSLRALRGSDGQLLWRWRPADGVRIHVSTAAVTEDGHVVAQLVCRDEGLPYACYSRHAHVAVALRARTGELAWAGAAGPEFGLIPRLWKSTAAIPPAGVWAGGAALSYESRGNPAGVGSWRTVTDVYDATTGRRAWSSGLQPGSTSHMGTEWLGGGIGLVSYNLNTVALVREDGTWEVELEDVNADLEVADLGSAGTVLLSAWRGLHAYRVGDVLDASGATEPVAGWPSDVGRLTASDVDGDGVDEVIGVGLDWDAWVAVMALEGTFSSGDLLPQVREIVLLEAR